jgi:hypothetical protein
MINTLVLNQQEQPSSLRIMDAKTFCSIISRSKYKLKLLNEGYSRGDTHRKHIHKRLEYLSHLDWKNGDRLKCDKCNETIELNSLFFIHRRRSYNRFFHASCANILNLI